MGWGRIYEVPNDTKSLLATCSSKAQWYEALNSLAIENVPQLDTEDSIRLWGSKLNDLGHPAAAFFQGELHATYDEYDDPNVCFNGNEMVKSFLAHLELLGKQFFVDLFPSPIPQAVGESWLYEPLRNFLRTLSERGSAVVILWEN